MWSKMDWGIFFICTIFFMPIGILLCIMASFENKSQKSNGWSRYEISSWEDETFINSFKTGDKYEHRYN